MTSESVFTAKTRAELSAALNEDVHGVHDNGLSADVEPTTLPALAEVAEAISETTSDGQRDYYRQVIEALLHRAVARLQPRQSPKRQSPPADDFRKGVEELLDIGETSGSKLGKRRDAAAPLWKYSSGESLRKSTPERQPAWTRPFDDLTDELLRLADQADFIYTGRYLRDVPVDEAIDGNGSEPNEITGGDESSVDENRWGRQRYLVIGLGCLTLLAVIGVLHFTNGKPITDQGTRPALAARPINDHGKHNGTVDSETPNLGDARFFFDGRRSDQKVTKYSDPITKPTVGKHQLVLRVHVNNYDTWLASAHQNRRTIRGARVRVLLPTSRARVLRARAYITAHNAATVDETLKMVDTKPFKLEYIPLDFRGFTGRRTPIAIGVV